MIRSMKSCRFGLLTAILTFGAVGIFFLEPRPTLAQDKPPAQEPAKQEARTIEELRRLVAELEEQTERQHEQLRMTEASLKRARLLLADLQNPQASRPLFSRSGLSVEAEACLPDQAVVEKMEWKWDEKRTTPQASMSQLGPGFVLKLEPKKENPRSQPLTISREGQADFVWQGHPNTVFVRRGDVLYLADFNPITSGCSIVAFDLKAGKPVWRTHLVGIAVAHSKYRNLINLDVDDKHLTIYGNEMGGRYIELLDFKTGATVGHRVMDWRPGRP